MVKEYIAMQPIRRDEMFESRQSTLKKRDRLLSIRVGRTASVDDSEGFNNY